MMEKYAIQLCTVKIMQWLGNWFHEAQKNDSTLELFHHCQTAQLWSHISSSTFSSKFLKSFGLALWNISQIFGVAFNQGQWSQWGSGSAWAPQWEQWVGEQLGPASSLFQGQGSLSDFCIFGLMQNLENLRWAIILCNVILNVSLLMSFFFGEWFIRISEAIQKYIFHFF